MDKIQVKQLETGCVAFEDSAFSKFKNKHVNQNWPSGFSDPLITVRMAEVGNYPWYMVHFKFFLGIKLFFSQDRKLKFSATVWFWISWDLTNELRVSKVSWNYRSKRCWKFPFYLEKQKSCMYCAWKWRKAKNERWNKPGNE